MEDKFEVFNSYFLRKFTDGIADMKNIQYQGDRKRYPQMLKVSQSLDELFIYEKLKLYCSELSYRSISNPESLPHTEADFGFMDSIFTEIETQEQFNNQGIEVFNLLRIALQIHLNNEVVDLKLLEKIISLIQKSHKILGLEDSLGAYSLVNNLCIRAINTGLHEYSQPFIYASCEILNLHYDSNASFELPPDIYKNIISMVLVTKNESFFKELIINQLKVFSKHSADNRFEWGMQFIECYKNIFKKEDSDTYYNYCMGHIKYTAKEYKKAHQYLLKLNHKQDMFIIMSAKMLHLKILYEFYRYELDSYIDSLEHIRKICESYRKMIDYENQKKQIGYQKEYNSAFLNNFKKLDRFRHNYGEISNNNKDKKEKRNELKESFHQLPHSFKTWLIEKLEEV